MKYVSIVRGYFGTCIDCFKISHPHTLYREKGEGASPSPKILPYTVFDCCREIHLPRASFSTYIELLILKDGNPGVCIIS